MSNSLITRYRLITYTISAIVSFITLISGAGILGWFQKNFNYHPTWGSLGFLLIASAYIFIMCNLLIYLSLKPLPKSNQSRQSGFMGYIELVQMYNRAYVEIGILFIMLAFMACDAAAMANDYGGFLNCNFSTFAENFYEGELFGLEEPSGFKAACNGLNAMVVMSFILLLCTVFMFFGVFIGLRRDGRPFHHHLPPMSYRFYKKNSQVADAGEKNVYRASIDQDQEMV